MVLRSLIIHQNVHQYGFIHFFSLTGTACLTIRYGIGLFAKRTDRKLAPALFVSEAMRNSYVLDSTYACPSSPCLPEQAGKVLFFFWFQSEKPGFDLRERIQLCRIKKNTNPVPRFFIVHGEGITTYVNNRKPSIANGARGKKLNCIRQTLGGFAQGIKERSFGKMPVCLIHHEAPDKYAHSLEPME